MEGTPREALLARAIGSIGGGLPRNFWKLFVSSASANLADGITLVAIPLIATVSLDASPAQLAGIAVAFQVPMVLLGLLAGGLADRLDRRWTMVAVQVLRVTVVGALTLLAIADAVSLPALYAASLLIGVGEAFFETNAQSIIPSIVGRERLVIANGRLFAAETVMNSFIGPPVGGLLVAVGAPIALGGGTIGYAVAAVGLVLIVGRFRVEDETPQRHLAAEIGEGVGYLLGHRLLLTLSSMVALGRMGSAGFFALFALYAVDVMGLTAPQYGLLLVTTGMGSLVGSVIVGRAVDALGRTGVLMGATVVFAVSLLVPALTPNVLVVGASFFVSGIAIMAWNVTNVSLRQSILPGRLQGRVHATHRFMANVAGLIGAAMAGLLGEAFGLPVTFAVGAGIVMIGVLGRLVVSDERIRAAEADAEAEAA